MTLLVLDVRIPPGEINTEHEIWQSLVHLLPQILTFIIAFTLAGQHWISFINQFNYLQTADRNENVIAVFYLGWNSMNWLRSFIILVGLIFSFLALYNICDKQ
jgi:uncharacterized membrane protein